MGGRYEPDSCDRRDMRPLQCSAERLDAPSTPALRGLLGLAVAAATAAPRDDGPVVARGQARRATVSEVPLLLPRDRQAAEAIRAAFGPTWAFALCVATAESGLNPHAVGAEGEVSMWQLHPAGWLPGYFSWSEVDDVTDVEDTSRYVAQRVAQEGWGDFTGARRC